MRSPPIRYHQRPRCLLGYVYETERERETETETERERESESERAREREREREKTTKIMAFWTKVAITQIS